MRDERYCERKGECGKSLCTGDIVYSGGSIKSYYACNSMNGIIPCTLTENLTFQRRQTEALERIANKLEIKE